MGRGALIAHLAPQSRRGGTQPRQLHALPPHPGGGRADAHVRVRQGPLLAVPGEPAGGRALAASVRARARGGSPPRGGAQGRLTARLHTMPGGMRPVRAHVIISAPREDVYDLVADLAARVAWCDHYEDEFRLTRPRSSGEPELVLVVVT